MESLLDCARRVLERHPCPALPYTELHRLVCLERAGPPPDADFLLRRIRARPELFRCLEPWRGPWRPLTGDRSPGSGRYRSALADAGLPTGPWVVALHPVGSGGSSATAARIRVSVLRLSRTVDEGSSRALARWLLLLRQERALRPRLRRPSDPAPARP